MIGIPTGLFAGLIGGWLGGVISRISDALQSLPPLILAVAIIGIFGPGLTNAMVAIGFVMRRRCIVLPGVRPSRWRPKPTSRRPGRWGAGRGV